MSGGLDLDTKTGESAVPCDIRSVPGEEHIEGPRGEVRPEACRAFPGRSC